LRQKSGAKHGSHHDGNHEEGAGIDRKLHDPVADRLIPLEPLDIGKIHSIDDLVRAMSKTAFTGRQLGEAADVLEAMARDKDCFVVMTLAGAMTVAKQGLVIAELIDRGIVNAIVSTGALMAHGLVEATGRAHFRHNPDLSDEELYEAGYNRVYDTLEPEQNLDDVERVMAAVFGTWDAGEVMCSYKLNRAIGAHLAKRGKVQGKERGILKSAYEKHVPVFVPAFSDSELGLDYALTNRERDKKGKARFRFDPFEDLEHFAATLLSQKRLGIFTIGGGVPRNWSQQFGPFIELRHRRGGEDLPLSLWTAHLPGTGVLGRAFGQSLQRGGVVGQVCASGGRWKVWGSFCGCDRRATADCCGCARATEKEASAEKDDCAPHNSRQVIS
jgi:deoxyhypusine synthase